MAAPLRRFLYRHAAQVLTTPLGNFPHSEGQDFDALRATVRKGDVLLVAGDQRVSEVIRYLTQSSWSHAALYVGDELLRRSPETAAELEERYGEDARHMVVEALLESGVVASPLSKYQRFRVRLCRPFDLSEEDSGKIVDYTMSHLGCRYDVGNIFDLARYFLPVSIVPARLRRRALRFGSGQPTEVICSSMIAGAFESVGFPILPRGADSASSDGYHCGVTAAWPSRRPLARHLRMNRHPTKLITPRDFDLSPYFEIVKFTVRRAGVPVAASAVGEVASRGLARVIPFLRRFGRAAAEPEQDQRATG